jgi:hypothetical protein
MDLGQGIANAGNLFSQAIMAKHEEEQRRQREALAQQNQEEEMKWRMSQVDRQMANDAYNNSLRTVQYAPEGASLSPEAAQGLHPLIRDTYTQHQQAELPSRDIQMGGGMMGGQSREAKPERYDIRPPYRKEEAVAGIRADATRDVAATGAASRERIAAMRQQMTSYQQAMLGVQKDRTGLMARRLNDAITMHNELLANRTDLNIQDAQSAWDIAYARATAKNPDYKMPTPRPTGKPSATSGPAPDARESALAKLRASF